MRVRRQSTNTCVHAVHSLRPAVLESNDVVRTHPSHSAKFNSTQSRLNGKTGLRCVSDSRDQYVLRMMRNSQVETAVQDSPDNLCNDRANLWGRGARSIYRFHFQAVYNFGRPRASKFSISRRAAAARAGWFQSSPNSAKALYFGSKTPEPLPL